MRTLPHCTNKINRLQFSLTLCLFRENRFWLRYIRLQLLCLPLQKYSLITGSLALTSSNISSFFKSFGSLSGDGKFFISLINSIIAFGFILSNPLY